MMTQRNPIILKTFVTLPTACLLLYSTTALAQSTATITVAPQAITQLNGSQAYLAAKQAYNFGNYNQAAQFYSIAIQDPSFQQSPDYRTALYLLADARIKIGNLASGHQTLDSIIRLGKGPYYDEAIRLYFKSAGDLLDYQLLPTISADIRNNGPMTPETTFLLGQAYFKNHQYSNVIDLFRYLLPFPPYRRIANYYIGASYVASGDINSSIQHFQNNVMELPDDVGVKFIDGERMLQLSRLALARIAFQGGNLDSAIKWYDTVNPKSQQYLRALWEAAWVYIAHHNYKQAGNKLAKLLKYRLDPDFETEARILQADLALRLRHYDEADAVYQQLLNHYIPIEANITRYIGALKPENKTLDHALLHDLAYVDVPNFEPQTSLSKIVIQTMLKGGEGRPLKKVIAQISTVQQLIDRLKKRQMGVARGGEQVQNKDIQALETLLLQLHEKAAPLAQEGLKRAQAKFQYLVLLGQDGENKVAWQQKSDSTKRIKDLNHERKATIQQIFQNFAEIQ